MKPLSAVWAEQRSATRANQRGPLATLAAHLLGNIDVNRNERRAAAAKARPVTPDSVVATHEAGHAVARYLTAREFGISVEEAITYIGVGGNLPDLKSVDGKAVLKSQACTYGPMLSAPLQDFVTSRIPLDQISKAAIKNVFAKDAANVDDIYKWLRARHFIAVMGAAAEAKARGLTFTEVLNSYQVESDVRSSIEDCYMMGMTDANQMQALLDEAASRAVQAMARDDVWKAVSSVVAIMPSKGRLSGKKVAAAIRALGLSDSEYG